MNASAAAPRRAWSGGRAALVVGAILSAQLVGLLIEARPAFCPCGSIRFWPANLSEVSQQAADWYSLSHIAHGLIFYALLRLAIPRAPLGARLALASLIEAAWEILENSPPIIARYRQSVAAQTYAGDSMLNSASDALCMIAGFLVAARAPPWASLALALALEAIAAFAIHDNLTLNVLNLLWPQDWLHDWQAQVWRTQGVR